MRIKLTSQQGLSLIEILIALLISTVIALAILRAYVTTIHTVGNSASGAKGDGNVVFGLATADRILQGAGYGVSPPPTGNSYGQTFLVYSSGKKVDWTASVGTSISGDSLVWSTSSGTCQALIFSKLNNPLDSNSTLHTGSGLFYYGGDGGYGNCNSNSSNLPLPTSADNPTVQVLIPFNDVNEVVAVSSPLFVQKVSCNPYGINNTVNNGNGSYSIKLTANVYAGSGGQTQNAATNTTCLFNFK